VDQGLVVGWILAAMTEEDVETAQKLWAEQAKERAHLDAEYTEDQVALKAAWCQEATSSVLNAMAKKIRIWAKSKRWWNADIKRRRNGVGREKRRRQNSEVLTRERADLQYSIWLSKIQMCSNYLQNLRGA